MKIVNTGSSYYVYDDNLKTYDSLPAKTYVLEFNKMEGFFLSETEGIRVTEKIYGTHQSKVNKVLNSFKVFSRNLGVILSGDKGIGKSICAKLLSEKAVSEGYPVILVNFYVRGIADYLASLKQEVVVVFDEFDKTFKSTSDEDSDASSAQAEMLTLFDGIHSGKKLFVVTCNNLRNLNEFIVNRPGRFHYHFRFDYPTPEEIREYLEDKLDKSLYGEIDKVVSFSGRVDINYDCLRSIAFELSQGESFESAIQDLNIVNTNGSSEYSAFILFADGTRASCKRVYLDFFDGEDTEEVRFEYDSGYYLYVEFNPADSKYSFDQASTEITADDIISIDWRDRRGNEISEDSDELPTSAKIVKVVFKRKPEKGIHYAF